MPLKVTFFSEIFPHSDQLDGGSDVAPRTGETNKLQLYSWRHVV